MYKLILLSLYGRFGLRPDASITKVTNYKDLKFYLTFFKIENVVKISEAHFFLTYKRVIQPMVDLKKESNKDLFFQLEQEKKRNFVRQRFSNTAVHLAAAITAYSRIYMYPFIQDESVLYTDTDSIITSKPLDPLHVSSTDLGKLKLEAQKAKYVGIAPKLYALRYLDGTEKVVKCGLGKESLFDKIKNLYDQISKANPNPFDTLSSNIRVKNWKKLEYLNKILTLLFKQPKTIGRTHIFDNFGRWVDTAPFHLEENFKSIGNHVS